MFASNATGDGSAAGQAANLLARWREAGGRESDLPADVANQLPGVVAASHFIGESLARDPGVLAGLVGGGELGRCRSRGEIAAAASALLELGEEAAFMAALRRLRHRELLRIAWRDLTGAAGLAEVLAELSQLADAAIKTAIAFAEGSLQQRYGVPRSDSGMPQSLVVIGMGKLGGGELNFSSDIDLVFLFPEAGETNGRQAIANEDYFTRLGQSLIRLLDARTAEGFVFRVDMRLRPFGDSGPLVASFGAFEDYLQKHGRDWERYAYVKARAITGVEAYGELYDEVVRPFVYRRYLDFGVFESLRGMKQMIAREVARRDLQEDIKLGPGGIREIEFIVQAHQLIRGGSDSRLQDPALLEVLPQLAGAKLLPADAVACLRAAYEFLRRVENRLQMFADQQTHALPVDDSSQLRLARSMGFENWAGFAARLESVRAGVTAQFGEIVIGPMAGGEVAPAVNLAALWAEAPLRAAVERDVARIGIDHAAAVATTLLELRDSGYYRRLDEFGRRRLATLLPLLLQQLASGQAGEADDTQALSRLLRIIEAIGGRTAYLALLNENPVALGRLVRICRLGEYLARQVAAHPLLLDELLDSRVFESLPDRDQFARELDIRLEHAGGDEERQTDALRLFRRAALFRVATLDLTGRLPLMQVSDRLTDVAELILERALQLAWRQTVAVHGEPHCDEGAGRRAARVAVIGYGKLGGMELGYASDLDLVFLHDSTGDQQQTTGPKVVENALFFVRLVQRLVHLLTVATAAGRLYDVDMRLRPSGKGGLAFTHIGAFGDYLRGEAWTWEHQALLHSRSVAGDPMLAATFEQLRRDVLVDSVRRVSLREDVVQMRERMRGELAKSGEGQFDLKQDRGGIADIEFLAQYWVLRWADRQPLLCRFPDTIRQLESVGSAALVDHRVIDGLVDAYRKYRQVAHRLSLERQSTVVDGAAFTSERDQVASVWQQVMVAGMDRPPV